MRRATKNRIRRRRHVTSEEVYNFFKYRKIHRRNTLYLRKAESNSLIGSVTYSPYPYYFMYTGIISYIAREYTTYQPKTLSLFV